MQPKTWIDGGADKQCKLDITKDALAPQGRLIHYDKFMVLRGGAN